jgi:hypothetical protein
MIGVHFSILKVMATSIRDAWHHKENGICPIMVDTEYHKDQMVSVWNLPKRFEARWLEEPSVD